MGLLLRAGRDRVGSRVKSLTIGRNRANDVVILDRSISRRHARLDELGNGRYRLTDLGSTQGTFVRVDEAWSRIEQAEIATEQEIRIGNHTSTAAELVYDISVTELPPDAETRRIETPGAAGARKQPAEPSPAPTTRTAATKQADPADAPTQVERTKTQQPRTEKDTSKERSARQAKARPVQTEAPSSARPEVATRPPPRKKARGGIGGLLRDAGDLVAGMGRLTGTRRAAT